VITEGTRLRVNTDEIAAEVVEGEAVLINLSNGTYYTMGNVGAVVWSMIERRYSLAEMVERLATAHGVERATVLDDLRALAADLVEEGLVVVARDASPVAGEFDSRPDDSGYTPPTLERYTDMAEVLALDPPLPVIKETV
jgi:hypothetical protein